MIFIFYCYTIPNLNNTTDLFVYGILENILNKKKKRFEEFYVELMLHYKYFDWWEGGVCEEKRKGTWYSVGFMVIVIMMIMMIMMTTIIILIMFVVMITKVMIY